MARANVFQDRKTEILWISDYSRDETGIIETVTGTLDLTKCRAIEAEFVSAHFYGLSLSYDLVIVKNKKGLYSILTPFYASMGNGAIYASICRGFEYKSAYSIGVGYPNVPVLYVIAETADDKWGMIKISRTANLWQDYCSLDYPVISLPQEVIRFDKNSLSEVLEKSRLTLSALSLLSDKECLRDLTEPNMGDGDEIGVDLETMFEARNRQAQYETPTPTPAQTITTGGYTRNSSIPFQVTFPDGTVIAEKNASKTFIASLQKIGLTKVQSVGIDIRGYNLVSDAPRPSQGKTKKWQDYVNDKYIYTKLGNAQKIAFLYQIADALGINLNIKSSEENDGITMPPTPQPQTQADDTKPTAKQPQEGKTVLRITLPDGTIIQEKQAKDTFIKAIKAAGPAKLLDRRIDKAEPVVSRTRHSNPNYARAQHPIEGGFLVLTQFSTKRKKELLEKIGKLPGIDMKWKVEIV